MDSNAEIKQMDESERDRLRQESRRSSDGDGGA